MMTKKDLCISLRALMALCLFLVSCATVQAREKIQWTTEELTTLARTLAGECYDHKEQDKRKVCEVILNRVSSGKFGNTVLKVAAAPNQFRGYWKQSRPISESDYRIAAEALRDWNNNGRKPLSRYLYFSAGPNRENKFR